jgi:hypothetical protein
MGHNGDGGMENMFYAVLALHVAGKPVNKENIRAVFGAAGSPVNEPALDAMSAFVESLEAARWEREKPVDPRIIRFLTSELAHRRVQTERVQTLIEELTMSIVSAPEPDEAALTGREATATRGDTPVAAERLYRRECIRDDAGAAAETAVEDIRLLTQVEGRYIYGIAACTRPVVLGRIGIEGNEVYTIPYKDICAIVHNCPAVPYQSKDEGTVTDWVRAHQNVLDRAKDQLGTVIPMGFDVILQPRGAAASPDQVVSDWLKEDYERLCTTMEKIKDKDEYGIQISHESGMAEKQILEQSEEIRRIKEVMATKAPGMAYMYRQKLEKAVKTEIEKLATGWFKDFYSRIEKHTNDIVVEKTKKLNGNKVMLLNLSCLVSKDKVDGLGEELEKINNTEGFSVHFTGPWPPYAFAAKPVIPAEKEMKNGSHPGYSCNAGRSSG